MRICGAKRYQTNYISKTYRSSLGKKRWAFFNGKYVRTCHTNTCFDGYKIHISHVFYLTPLYQTEENMITHDAEFFYLISAQELHCRAWVSMGLHGSPWVSMGLNGSQWISTGLHGSPRVSNPRSTRLYYSDRELIVHYVHSKKITQ